MRNIFKTFYFITIELLNTVVSITSVLLFSSISCNKRIKRILNKHKNTECCVLGNGPSLNDIFNKNPDTFKNMDFMVVNYFSTTKFFTKLQPRYYIIIDNQFFLKSYDDKSLKRKILEFIDLINSVTWQMILFIPSHTKGSLLERTINNSNIELTYINLTPVKGFKKIKYFFYKNNLGMPMAQTVINAAIFMAVQMDYHTIHLYGVDQSWLKGMYVDENNIVRAGLDHFYKGSDKISEIPSLSNLLITQYNVFYGHEQIQDYAEYKNIIILNHVKDSYIDAYKKTN